MRGARRCLAGGETLVGHSLNCAAPDAAVAVYSDRPVRSTVGLVVSARGQTRRGEALLPRRGQRCRGSTGGHEGCVECRPRGFRARRPRLTGPAAAQTGTAPGRPRLDGAPVTLARRGSGSAPASRDGGLAGTGVGGGPERSAADRAEHRVIIAVGLARRHPPRRWRRHRTNDRVGLSPARRDLDDVRTLNR